MVEVFDNTLMEDTREQFYMFCTTANYQIGWGDNSTFEDSSVPLSTPHSNPQEWKDLTFIESIINPS